MKFGLDDALVADIKALIGRAPWVKRAFIFGSRARGDFHPGSDIDLAIEAPGASRDTFAALCVELEKVPMVFRLDIVRLDEVQNPLLLARIQRDAIALFEPHTLAGHGAKD